MGFISEAWGTWPPVESVGVSLLNYVTSLPELMSRAPAGSKGTKASRRLSKLQCLLISHVGKEAFITALSDGNLQLEVLKHEPPNIEAALSQAIKVEAYEQSLACRSTLVTDQDEGSAKHWSHDVYAVSYQPDPSEAVALGRRVEKLQEALKQATNGIAALAAGPWSGRATQSDAAASVGPARGAAGKKNTSKGTARAQGVGRGKFGHGSMGRCQDPKTDPCQICKQLGHWSKNCDQHKKPTTAEPANVCFLSTRVPDQDLCHSSSQWELHPLPFSQWM